MALPSSSSKNAYGFLAVIVGLAVLGVSHLATPATANARSYDLPDGFCRPNRIVHNYWRPLDLLPNSRAIPESGKLRFGPNALRIFPPHDQLVVVNRDRFNLAGSLVSQTHSSAASLNWWSLSRLDRVDRHGSILKHVKEKEQYIGDIEGFNRRDFGFGSVSEPGLYSLVLSFRSRSGQILNEYQEFFRAVRPRSSLKLSIGSAALHSGDFGYLRVENYGTATALFSYRYRLWKLRNGRRSKLALGPLTFSGDQPVAAAGMASRCFTFKVPDYVPVGVYTVGIRVNSVLLPKPRVVLAQFHVVA